ncbi:glycosyltransferase family 39 protein [Poriferisphaera sp. WC338]|uniref:glycosyltransferase family 39 protein n=1 Tax=Poriferisphaera sp. WC338 TaxID=3425129 RepID=UPI003D815510
MSTLTSQTLSKTSSSSNPPINGQQSSMNSTASPQATATKQNTSLAFSLSITIFIAITARLLFFALGPATHTERALYPDSYRYIELSENLATTGTFALAEENSGLVHVPLAKLRKDIGQFESPNKHTLYPEIFRTPGYPIFLAAFRYLHLPFSVVLLIQCLLAVISVALIYLTAYSFFKSIPVASLAAVLIAIHPADIIAPSSLLSETLFTTLLLTSIFLVTRPANKSIAGMIFAGFALGLSVLVRPISIALAPAFALWLIVTRRNFKSLACAAVLILTTAAPISLWMYRNHSIGFGYRISSVPYINSYFYTSNYMTINEAGGDYGSDWAKNITPQHTALKEAQTQNPNQDVFTTMQTMSMDHIKEKPAVYASVLSRSFFKFFTDHSMPGLYTQLGLEYTPSNLLSRFKQKDFSLSALPDPAAAIIALSWFIFNAILLMATVIGLLMMLIRRQWAPLLLLGGTLCYFMLATQATGLERFRLPVMGIQMIIIAAMFVPAPPKPEKKQPKQSIKDKSIKRFKKDEQEEAPRPVSARII